MVLALLGTLAGVLTTLAGLGGGILLQVALSLAVGPHRALAITAPALLVGNLHRALLYRAHIDRDVAHGFVLGALPGSVLGGLAALALPVWSVHALMLAMVSLALLRRAGVWRWRPSRAVMLPAAAGIGAVSATSGGAGLLVSPLMLAAGLTGERYVSTVAVGAVAMHAGRLFAYGVGGMVTHDTLAQGAVLTVAILVGNGIGARLRRHLDDHAGARIEVAVLCVATVCAIAGVGR